MFTKDYTSLQSTITDRLMQNVRDISYPRIVGSEGEKKAQIWLKSQITSRGYSVKTEPVLTSLYRINFLQSLSTFVGGILLLLCTWFFDLHPLFFLLPIMLILIIIAKVSSGSIETGQPPNVPAFVKVTPTENIIAESPSQSNSSGSNSLNIVFIGHYDSKSTRLSGFQRLLFYLIFLLCAIVVLFGGIFGIIMFVGFSSSSTGLVDLLWITSIIGCIAGIILSFNVVGNKSPGATDNGTAVSLLLEHMTYFKEHPLEGVNITYLFSAAEEIGLTGALHFINQRKHESQWAPERTFIINYDLAGLKGPILLNTAVGIPRRETSKMMNDLLVKIAQEQTIPVISAYLPIGGWHDGLPFMQYGYDVAMMTGKSYLIHTAKDTVDLIDPTNFYACFVLGTELVKKICLSKSK